MPNIRIPLVEDIEARDSLSDKDALTVNANFDMSVEGNKYCVKRAGYKAEVSGSGVGQGIFTYGTVVYQWDAGVTALTPRKTNVSALT
jgi:hypothetical protein